MQDSFPEYTAVAVGNSGAIWTGAGGLTLSRSVFQNRISSLYYRAPVQPALGPLCTRCTQEPVLRFICGVWAQHVQWCSEQASRYNIQFSDRTAGCDEWQSRIRMEQSVNAMMRCPWRTFNSLSFFLYYAYPIILNDRLCRIYLFSLLNFSQC